VHQHTSTILATTHLPQCHLLRSTLHPLSARRNIVVILVHGAGGAVSAPLRALAGVNVLQFEILNHRISRRLRLLHTRWQDLLQEIEVLELILLRELDIELDVQVTEVVVAVRGHTLALDHLDGT
jgi:shikimate 5-dehydrogenase